MRLCGYAVRRHAPGALIPHGGECGECGERSTRGELGERSNRGELDGRPERGVWGRAQSIHAPRLGERQECLVDGPRASEGQVSSSCTALMAA